MNLMDGLDQSRSRPELLASANFETDVEPLLRATGLPTYVFAGDMGAFPSIHSFMYHESGNIHYIASGMGGGTKDNFVICRVAADGTVEFDLIALNGDDIHALGELTDFRLDGK